MSKESITAATARLRNIPCAFRERAESSPSATVFEEALLGEGSGERRPRRSADYSTVAAQVWRLSHYLRTIGVAPGDSVAILSFTRPEWMIADLATLGAGAVSVSIYQSVTAAEVGYILNDSAATVVFAENREQVEKIFALLEKPCAIPATEDRPAREVQLGIRRIITFEAVDPHPLVTTLAEVLADTRLPSSAPLDIEAIDPNSTASLVYTSGTTGPPKGVIQTHANHLANVCQAERTLLFEPQGSIFLFLPLAHSFARLIGYIGFLTATVVKFPAVASRENSAMNAASVLQDLRESGAECAPMVPRILEKLMEAANARARGKSVSALVLRAVIWAAVAQYRAKRLGAAVPLLASFVHGALHSVRKKLRIGLFGEGFRQAVSGGAKLPEHVAEFFWALDMPVYEGYGLTETCVATNVNPIGKMKLGSVGPALEEVELAIDADGEILFRGPNITKGYFNRPTATKQSWDANGWFHTGDLGRLDEDGYLYIVGRKKELIVTAGGKKIPPQPIEDALTSSPFISHAIYCGEGKPYCIVLVTLELAAVRDKLKISTDIAEDEIAKRRDVIELIRSVVDRVNGGLAQFETIKKFRILPHQLTVENGLLTPSFKVKRNVVTDRFRELVESAYLQGRDDQSAG